MNHIFVRNRLCHDSFDFSHLFEEDDSSDCNKRLEENTVTMEKMNELKTKLEELSVQRKVQKVGTLYFKPVLSKLILFNPYTIITANDFVYSFSSYNLTITKQTTIFIRDLS